MKNLVDAMPFTANSRLSAGEAERPFFRNATVWNGSF
jgi:hypothetical protein